MGNSNNKRRRHSHGKYASQFSCSDIIGGSCSGTTDELYEEFRPWSRVSRRRWSEGTLNDPLCCAKTAWPVARMEALFLPEFQVRGESLKSEYTFIDIISKGAYGRVYKVRKIDTNKIYALKVVSKARIVAEDAVSQAKQEVAIQRAVGHHPFIANSPYHWQSRKTLYLLTEYIGGGELFSLVEEYGSLSEDMVRIYVAEIGLALDFLHNAGVVHRDLKATNVLLDDEGHAVLIDFGLAKWLSPTQRTNTFCGTPEYMAPEIVKREYYGHKVDWWSLGVLACFLLTNQYPTTAVSNLMSDRKSQDSFDPGTLPADAKITPAAADLLRRLLQPDPRMRIGSVLGLQRVAFYMGRDFQDYKSKTVSPFRLLGKILPGKIELPRTTNDFSDFDSFVGGSTTREIHTIESDPESSRTEIR
ncbi:serine/threonine-protein kinase S6KL [Cephus cinctus]|uniref:Serine/threonine-protein kinase S6KL n=1 Tax=Cephus cinctus TaxID=211228 RepID=A0AAJ7C7P6_CEPCN|nr:serine/threonine-protein kinase S6KL [Cephus cinctus]